MAARRVSILKPGNRGMEPGALQPRGARGTRSDATGRWNAALTRRRNVDRAQAKEEGIMQAEAKSKRLQAVAAHPLAELLACPPTTGTLLTASAQTIAFDSGQTIFHQFGPCAGLYLVIHGHLLRRTDRMETRITLGTARPGTWLSWPPPSATGVILIRWWLRPPARCSCCPSTISTRPSRAIRLCA